MAAALAERGLRPIADLAARREHGDRLRYLAGCRCADCRRANTQYETTRAAARKAGDWNGIVPAAKAREHMANLSAAGVGRRVVCDVSGIASSVLVEIIAGRKTSIRARTERAILVVTTLAAADYAYIDAAPTWKMLDELIADGYTKSELAIALGAKTRALQLSRNQVTVRHAYQVKRLHERLRLVDATKTLALLDDLSEEGFHRDRVRKLLVDLGADEAALKVRKGRMLASAAAVVERLHAQLTAE